MTDAVETCAECGCEPTSMTPRYAGLSRRLSVNCFCRCGNVWPLDLNKERIEEKPNGGQSAAQGNH